MSRRERDEALMAELRKLVDEAEWMKANGAEWEDIAIVANKAFSVAVQVIGVQDAS